ncbi:MAG: tRNA threonylcarbamoyladenosine dehydratase [Clostridiaceae bacterium]|nr:tRNA threonylcarbamoyladenosine dehydratase [Clostridiaceae bacterium]
MEDFFSRTENLLGKQAMLILKNSSVAVFGLGGVGSYAAEALARVGIGEITLIDSDVVDRTNLNRQLIALTDTIGEKKVDVMSERIKKINPTVKVNTLFCFYDKSTQALFDFSSYHYIVDAIDTVTSKLLLIKNAKAANVPIISCMGTGNKIDPTKFEVDDIYSTSMCPLAKVMRKELKQMGIPSLLVVYSKEPPIMPQNSQNALCEGKRHIPGSVSFVPPVAGFILASEVVEGLIKVTY